MLIYLSRSLYNLLLQVVSFEIFFMIYPVRKPRHLWRGCKRKSSFIIEGGVKAPSFLTGFTSSPRNTLNPTAEAFA